jgi:hypothetical protein
MISGTNMGIFEPRNCDENSTHGDFAVFVLLRVIPTVE